MDACCKAGLDPNEVASRFWYHAHLGMDIFEEVAKIRAWRLLWATTMKERYGCTNPKALSLFIYGMTGGLSCPAQEPLNNIIRLTILTLAGVLAGADGIGTASYDGRAAGPVSANVSTDYLLPGDANDDDVVNIFDMTKVARIILELDDPTPGADANQDGSINIFDMTKIARIILELD